MVEAILYNNAVHSVIYGGWYCIHMWKTLARPNHFTKRAGMSS